MRLKTISILSLLLLALPLWADVTTYNEAKVESLDGTIMVQHADGSKPTALQTGSTIQKGDVITVYDGAWVVFKTHRGDHIGLDGNTVVSVDEYYIGGPSREIRLMLQKGSLLLRTGGADSRQSFFEIYAGSVVVGISDTEAILQYDPDKSHLNVQYFRGKLSVIDKDTETKFTEEHTEENWVNGSLVDAEPQPIDDETVWENFKRFFDGRPRLTPQDNNIVLPGSTM